MEEQPTLNYQQAAETIPCSVRTVRRLVHEGYLTPYGRPDSKGHFFKPTTVKQAYEQFRHNFKEVRPKKYKKKKKVSAR